MYLTLSKKFEFSSSVRLFNPSLSSERNIELFGREVGGRFGFGRNFTAFFVFHGEVERETGMIINVTEIKREVSRIVNARYDHKFLNVDTKPFDTVVPTAENVARHLLQEVRGAFTGHTAQPVVCHLIESPFVAATAFADGRVTRHRMTEFSAARRTFSPNLSDNENEELFGIAASPAGHGHGYRLEVTLRGEVDRDSGLIAPLPAIDNAIEAIGLELDHRHLNTEVTGLSGQPITTEVLSRYIWQQLADRLPVERVRLWENSWFFVECIQGVPRLMGIRDGFFAAHRLHSPLLSAEKNVEIYAKCNNPKGHGHWYEAEATVEASLDERTGTLFPLDRLVTGVKDALAPWNYRHLNEDTDDFEDRPTTSENIVQVLHPRIGEQLDHPVHRLRLWETPNNRFALRIENP